MIKVDNDVGCVTWSGVTYLSLVRRYVLSVRGSGLLECQPSLRTGLEEGRLCDVLIPER